MPDSDHPISGARRPPRGWLLGGLALAVVLVVGVVLLVARSSDGPELTVIDGAPGAGFPLRGDLARDRATIRAAAEAWLADDAREDDDDQVLDYDEEVEIRALWAGRLGDAKVVILANRERAALVEFDDDGDVDGRVLAAQQRRF